MLSERDKRRFENLKTGINFSELTELKLHNLYQTYTQFYIHLPTKRAFGFHICDGVTEIKVPDWERKLETGNFAFGDKTDYKFDYALYFS